MTIAKTSVATALIGAFAVVGAFAASDVLGLATLRL